MRSFHSNILKLINQIINQIAANIYKFTFSDQDFTHCRKFNAVNLIKLISNIGAFRTKKASLTYFVRDAFYYAYF